MNLGRRDPGACPVCGMAHSACTSGRGPITAVQLPARDAAVGVLEPPVLVGDAGPPPLVAEIVQATLPPSATTTGTYRGRKKAR